jgi:hypothetical protein
MKCIGLRIFNAPRYQPVPIFTSNRTSTVEALSLISLLLSVPKSSSPLTGIRAHSSPRKAQDSGSIPLGAPRRQYLGPPPSRVAEIKTALNHASHSSPQRDASLRIATNTRFSPGIRKFGSKPGVALAFAGQTCVDS